ncbi:MAG: hypothetical protein U0235_12600 [Polyangiaceae bacterium]
MRTRFWLRGVAAFGVCAVSFVAACSLGLDPSKLVPVEEAGVEASVEPLPDVVTNVPPGSTLCKEDKDCADGGCLSGRCQDGVCHFEVCPTEAFPCMHRTCGADNKCSDPPTPHKFVAQHMTLGNGGLGCGNSLGACVAVAYPFAFVQPSSSEAVAFPIVDLTPGIDGGDVAPPAVRLTDGADGGVGFTAQRVVANGDRVWLVGPPVQGASGIEVPLGWVDVPPNPQLTTLRVNRGSISLPIALGPGATITGALPMLGTADKGLILLLADTPVSVAFRATQIRVVDGGVDPKPSFNVLPGFDGGVPIVASSGDRLLTAHSVSGPPTASFPVDIISRAGAPNAVSLGEQDLALTMGALYPGVTFASTPLGKVVAQGAVGRVDDGGLVGVDSVRVAWIVQKNDDPNRAASPITNLITYPEPDAALPAAPDPGLVGPVTSVGEDAIMALQGVLDGGAAVRVAKRGPNGALLDTLSAASLPLSPTQYVISGARSDVTSKSYAYAFSRPLTQGDGVKLTIFELGCGN